MGIASIYLGLACVSLCAHLCMYIYTCEYVCDSPNAEYFMLFSLATMKIFPKDKMLVSKPHSQGGMERTGEGRRARGHGKQILVVVMLFNDLEFPFCVSSIHPPKYILFVIKKTEGRTVDS